MTDHADTGPGQPEMLPGLARAAARRGRAPAKKPPVTAAEVDPVARVLVDLPLAHLDRPFDYLVPETMADAAVPGARVKVRFAGQDVDAYVVARAAARRGRAPAKKPPVAPAEVDPVAQVLVDLPLAHLDRPFDYLVPETMADEAVPGARVKVRFAGQDVDAYVVARAAASDHEGRLSPLRRVVSAEPVLAPEIAALSADVARRYAGARADVLRLAVPPRHATAEKKESAPAPSPDLDPTAAAKHWDGHVHGGAFVEALAAGGAPRAVWSAAPGADWPALLAQAAVATYASGRPTRPRGESPRRRAPPRRQPRGRARPTA